jgi:hypothetical protein
MRLFLAAPELLPFDDFSEVEYCPNCGSTELMEDSALETVIPMAIGNHSFEVRIVQCASCERLVIALIDDYREA